MTVVTEAISFSHELDLLEVHLEESQHWADRIIIIESPVTFTTQPKPLFFDDNKERFARFNVEHIITDPDIFEPVAASYSGDEDNLKYYRARRNNRNLNRQHHWENLRNGCDYVYCNDVDEFVSRDHWYHVDEYLKDKEYYYGGVKTRKFNFFVNVRGSKQSQYRITRSDMETFNMERGTPRFNTAKEVGWHFTS